MTTRTPLTDEQMLGAMEMIAIEEILMALAPLSEPGRERVMRVVAERMPALQAARSRSS